MYKLKLFIHDLKQEVFKILAGALVNKKETCLLANFFSNCCNNYLLLQHKKKSWPTQSKKNTFLV